MRCKYLQSSSIQDLEKEVNCYLENDWEMFGPLLSTPSNGVAIYHQTMTKHSHKVEPKKQFNQKIGIK